MGSAPGEPMQLGSDQICLTLDGLRIGLFLGRAFSLAVLRLVGFEIGCFSWQGFV